MAREQQIGLFGDAGPRRGVEVENPTPCRACGSRVAWCALEVFSNGTEHVRETCEGCGEFLRWRPQTQELMAALRAAP